MGTYSIQAPDGSTFRIQANDPQSAMQAAQRQWLQSQAVQRGAQRLGTADPRTARAVPLAASSKSPAPQDGPLAWANGLSRSFAEGVPVAGGLLNRGNAAIAATVAPAVEPLLDRIPGYDSSQDLTRSGGWGGRYARALAMQNGEDAGFKAKHPVAATAAGVAGNIAGSVALARGFGAPAGAAPKPAPTGILGHLANAGKTIATGTAIGAADGATRAPAGQVVHGTEAGAGMGALTTAGMMAAGAVAKPFVRAGANAIRNAVGGDVPGINGDVSTTDARRAATYVGRTMSKAGIDIPGLAASGAPYEASGKDFTAAEALGPRGVTALSALARRAGQTGGQAKVFFGDRRVGMGDRILGGLSSLTGIDPEGARGNIDAVVAKGQMDATPMFDAVRATPGPVWNANLAALSDRPAIRDALKLAYTSLKNAGKDPTQMGLAIDPDTGAFKVASPTVDPANPNPNEPTPLGGVLEPQPKAEAWEYVRRMLGDLATPPAENAPAKAKIYARDAQVAQGDLTNELAGVRASDGTVQGGLIPGYRDAIDTAGDYLRAKGAFDQTRGVLFGTGRGNTAYDMSKLWDTFQTPGEQSAAQHAVAADIYDQAMSGRLTPARWGSKDFAAKLNIAFPDQAKNIIGGLKQETDMFNNGNQITPSAGSQTTPLREEMAEQDAVHPAADFAIDAAKGAATGLFHGGLHGAAVGVGGAALKQGVKLFDAWARAPGLSEAGRDEAGRLLMASPEDLAGYLQTYKLSQPPLQLGSPSAFTGGGLGGILGNGMLPRQQPYDPYQLQPAQ